MFTEDQLKAILTQGKIVSPEEFIQLSHEAQAKNKKLENYLIEKKIISEELLYETVANYFGVPFINLRNLRINKEILFLIPETIAHTHEIIAFEKDKQELKVATLDPADLQIFEFIEKKTGLKLKIHLTAPSNLKEVLKQYHKTLKAEFQEISASKEEIKEGAQELKQLAQDLPVVRVVDTILEYAVYENASDIHIEPQEKEVIIRYRIDGVLRDIMTLPKETRSGIVARIKVLSNLKLDEHRLPQDGRFKIETSEYRIALRVSIIPVFGGEKIVLRLLNEKAQILSLEQLGLLAQPFETVKMAIKKPHGMILITGPTGCGKTTTLYTILNILNTKEVNIATIEDPIEYRIPRVNQSQVNPKIGFTFASGLRSLLRQDPNIIMVGEIRDNETADIAVNAAMTGHLVLSTLHTNDAPTALPRLLDMGIPAFLIASTTNLIIAQRLVRKICTNCIMSFYLDKESITVLEKELNLKDLLKTLEREKAILSAEQSLKSLLFYKGKGCRQCNNEGYKGRIGIYEVLEITPTIAELILKKASQEELKRAAQKQGMLTILEDGFIKAKNGITTIEEVLRVTKE